MQENTRQENSLRSQSFWLLFAKVVGFFFAFLLPPLIVRYLPPEKVGLYRQVFLVITNATAIMAFGVPMSAYYYLSREAEKRAAAVFNILIFNSLMGALACAVLFVYPQILEKLLENKEITPLAPLIGVVIFFWMFSSFVETVAVANRESRVAATFIILAQLTKTAFMSAAVLIFSTVESFLYAAIVQAVLQSVVLLAYSANRFPRFWTKFNPQFFREQLIYALPFGFAGVLYTMQNDIHNYFVSRNFSLAEFAIYAYGCFQLPLIGMIHESVSSVMIPRMTELQSRGEEREIISLTTRAIQKLAFFYFPIYTFLIITAQTLFLTLFTEKYLASVPIFLINITILPFDIWITDPIVRAYESLGKFLLKIRIFVFAAMVGALYFVSQNFDLRGMIAIVVAATFIERLIMVIVVAKTVGFRRKDFSMLKDLWKTAAASVAAGLVLLVFYRYGTEFILPLLKNLTQQILAVFGVEKLTNFIGGGLFLAICSVVFSAVYLPTANFFGIWEESEKEKIKSVWRKFFPETKSLKTETGA